MRENTRHVTASRRTSAASEPRDRSERGALRRCSGRGERRRTAQQRARERVGEFEGRSPSMRIGAPGRNRTCNLWLRRPTLYPIELRARQSTVCSRWSRVSVFSLSLQSESSDSRSPSVAFPRISPTPAGRRLGKNLVKRVAGPVSERVRSAKPRRRFGRGDGGNRAPASKMMKAVWHRMIVRSLQVLRAMMPTARYHG